MNRVIQVRCQWPPDELQTAVKRAMRAHYGSEFGRGMTLLMLLGLFLFNGSVFGHPDGRDLILCWVGLSLLLRCHAIRGRGGHGMDNGLRTPWKANGGRHRKRRTGTCDQTAICKK